MGAAGVVLHPRLRGRRGVALVQQMAKLSPAAGLLRLAWDSVGRIVERVVADHLDEKRLRGLVAIGCDEISYAVGSAPSPVC